MTGFECFLAVVAVGLLIAAYERRRGDKWRDAALALEKEKQKAEQERDAYKCALGLIEAAIYQRQVARVPTLSQIAQYEENDEWPDVIG